MLDIPELRAELIETAQEYLDDQYKMNLKFGRVAFDAAVKAGTKTYKDYAEFFPPKYTMTDVMQLAKQLEMYVVSGTL